MVHDIDLMTYVLGEYPVEVFTVANGQIPEIAAMKDYDNVVSTFKFKSGSRVVKLLFFCETKLLEYRTLSYSGRYILK